ncbi:MAG: hypothetical protein QXN55_09270 [Candidatus Nitrosotenuis sp.]
MSTKKEQMVDMKIKNSDGLDFAFTGRNFEADNEIRFDHNVIFNLLWEAVVQ